MTWKRDVPDGWAKDPVKDAIAQRTRLIHHLDGTFLISENGCWLPGVFASVEASIMAFGFGDDVLRRLQEEKNSADADPGAIDVNDLILARQAAGA